MNATSVVEAILRLLNRSATSEKIEIAEHGHAVAHPVPTSGVRTLEGSFEGRARTAVEGDELLSTNVPWSAA
jgi:antitoxin (DNA-binding transcriptional repressor) of toxin-antitoxin stability system